MAIFDFFLSRNNGPTVANYVGHNGRLFYDSDEKVLRVADGVTPGGFPITPTTLVSSVEPIVAAEGQLWYNPSTYELWAYHDGNFEPTIDLATETKIGGVKLGPGVTTNEAGQIIIDSTGLDFSFGDFAAVTETYPVGHPKEGEDYAILQTINDDEDAVLASNGLGGVKVVGNFQIYAPDGTVNGALVIPPVFTVGNDGQVKILVPDTDTTEGAVEIIGSSAGESIAPGQPGTMLHLTGQINQQCRFYMDGNGNYASIVGRRWNGTISGGRTQVLAGEDVLRINATAQTDATMPGVALAQISFTALENQTASAQGSSITLTVTPVGSAASSRVDALVVKSTGIELPVAGSTVKLLGSISGTITLQATATAGTNTITLPAVTGTVVTTGDTGSVTNTMLANSTISGIALGSNLAALTAGTYLTSGGTYNGSTARTFAVDATTEATASKVVARDANAIVAGSNFQGAVRNAGAVQGTTVTLNFNSDHMVHCTFTDNFTVAFSNYTEGRTITLIATNTSAFDTDIITAGISAVNMQGDATLTVTQQTTAIITYYCVGTTVNDVYASAVYA